MDTMYNVVETYENYREEDRLSTDNARRTEFITTKRFFDETFEGKLKILDCAAGTGIYAFYLAQQGHEVVATDITPRHIEYIKNKSEETGIRIKSFVLDATDLSCFEDESFDVVLNMGPMYHLVSEEMREKNLTECKRVLKKGGLLCTTYISKYFVFPFIAPGSKQYLNNDMAEKLIKTGVLRHDDPNCFWTDTYYFSVDEIERLYENNELKITDHFAQDGLTPFLRANINNLAEDEFKIWCDYHYSVCREKSILGASNHALIAGKK